MDARTKPTRRDPPLRFQAAKSFHIGQDQSPKMRKLLRNQSDGGDSPLPVVDKIDPMVSETVVK